MSDVEALLATGQKSTFGFHAKLSEEETSTNASEVKRNNKYTFSKKLDTIFVKRNVFCPFVLGMAVLAPNGSFLKVHVFSDGGLPVMRCAGHSNAELQPYDVAPLHFIRSDNSEAQYICDERTGELSVVLPFRQTEEPGYLDVQNFKFTCFSSCVKGNVFLQFSLVHEGTIIEQKVYGLHVCFSPRRDCFDHENKVKKRRRPELPLPPLPPLPDETELFYISTTNKDHFEILFEVNRALDAVEQARTASERPAKRSRGRQRASSHTVTSPDAPSTSSHDERVTLRRILVAQ